jgi:hypothetical protein
MTFRHSAEGQNLGLKPLDSGLRRSDEKPKQRE